MTVITRLSQCSEDNDERTITTCDSEGEALPLSQ